MQWFGKSIRITPNLNMAISLEDLVYTFQTKLEKVKYRIDLRGAHGDQTCQNFLKEINCNVDELIPMITSLKNEIAERKKSLLNFQKMRDDVNLLYKRIQHAQTNMPERIPSKEAILESSVDPSASFTASSSLSNTGTASTPNLKSSKKKLKKTKFHIPSLKYLTVEEFENVPKYMKGRISYEQINVAVDDLNKAFHGKFRLLKATGSKSSHNDVTKKKLYQYKQQESKETKGAKFIIEDDIREYSNLRCDSAGRAILIMLRHCGRMKEIRGGGLTRYVAC